MAKTPNKSTPDKGTTNTSGDIPAADDVIEGAARAKRFGNRSAHQTSGINQSHDQTDSGGAKRSVLIYISLGLSIMAAAGVIAPQLQGIVNPEKGLPDWQVALDKDKAEIETKLRDIDTALSALDAQLKQQIDRTAQTQSQRDIEQDDALEDIASTLSKLRSDMGGLVDDVRQELSKQTAEQQPTPNASRIWLEGLATASQVGQDLRFWKARIEGLMPPPGGWTEIESDIIDTLADAHTASYQSLISEAYALVEAAHLDGPNLSPDRDDDIQKTAGWLEWAGDILRFEKIETQTERQADPKLEAFMRLVQGADLPSISSALTAMDGLDLSAVQDWQAKYESRIALDRLIASAFVGKGGL